MVKKKLINRHQLQDLLQHTEIVGELEEFAVKSGRVSPREMTRYIEEKPNGVPLPEFLATSGRLTDNDIKAFFEKQLDSLKICELAVEVGMVSEEDLHRALHSPGTPRTIGEILCELNLVTPLDLNAVLSKYRKHLQLGEVLQRQGLIDQPTLDWALKVRESRGESLGSVLCKKGILTETQLFRAFSLQYNIPFENLEAFEYAPGQKEALTKTVEKHFSEQFQVLPLRLEENTLTVAISDPANLEAVNSLRDNQVHLRTRCVLATPSERKRLHTELYHCPPASPIQDRISTATDSDIPRKDVPREPTRPAVHEKSDSRRKPVDRRHPAGDTPAAVYEIVFRTPEISRTDLQRLHHAYESLVEKTGRRTRRSDIGHFDAFIRNHYRDIRRRYSCSKVAFCVMRQA
jgi:hypothetical protein